MVTKSPQTDGWSQNLRKMERRERLPENDKNNVAFYKKKKDVVASNPNGYYKAKTIRETDEQRDLGKTMTFSEKTELNLERQSCGHKLLVQEWRHTVASKLKQRKMYLLLEVTTLDTIG